MSYPVKLLAGLIGTALFLTFIFGLAHSISTGFAGFSGGLPFLVICIVVGLMATWDFIDECLRRK